MKANHGKKMFAVLGIVIMMAVTAGMMFQSADGVEGEIVSTGTERTVDTLSPTTSEEFVLQWYINKAAGGNGMGIDYSKIPSTAVIAGDHVYTRIGNQLLKISLKTGEEIASAATVSGNYLYGHWLSYADHGSGMILDGRNKAAYDMDLNRLFTFASSHQMMIYHDGFIYGITTSFGPAGSITKYDANDKNPAVAGETQPAIWTNTNIMSGVYDRTQYPVFAGNYGFAVGTEVIAFDLSDGRIMDTYSLGDVYTNNEPTYADGFLYVTTYTNGLFESKSTTNGSAIAIRINSDGTFGEKRFIELSSPNGNSNLVPYNGFGYVMTDAGLHIIDLSEFKEVKFVEGGPKFSRGGIVISTGYATADNGYKVYIYAVDYRNNETAYVFSHSYLDGDHTTTREAVTGVGNKEFSTESPQLAPGGYILWHNDSGALFCYRNVPGTEEMIKGDVNMDGSVDLRDATCIAQHICGIVNMNDRQLGLADHNGDGIVDLRDATSIARSVGYVFPVVFNVIDKDTLTPINNAKVTVYSDSAMKKTIDQNSLAPGTYYYRITATGYEPASGEFTITNGAATVEVKMTPMDPEDYYYIEDGMLLGYSGPETIVNIPEYVKGERITSIGAGAFSGNNEIIEVTIPNSVMTLANGAFTNCINLRIVNLGSGVSAITKNITDGLTGAFVGCASMEEINVHRDNTRFITIYGILYDRTNPSSTSGYYSPHLVPAGLRTAYIPSNVHSDQSTAYGPAATPAALFNGHKALETLYLEDGIKIIRSDSFNDCTALRDIHMPDTLTSYPSGCFNRCTALNYVVITYTVSDSFNDCTALRTVTILEGVKEIGATSFQGCTALMSVTMPSTLTKIGNNSFTDSPDIMHLDLGYLTSLGTNSFGGSTHLRSVVIGSVFSSILNGENIESVKLSSSASWNTNLQNASQKWSLRSLSVDAGNADLKMAGGILQSNDGKTIYHAPPTLNLGDLVIGDDVVSIAKYAFRGNVSLNSLYIPGSVTSIGESAFENCTSLKKVYFTGDTVPAMIGAKAFDNISGIRFYGKTGFDWQSFSGEKGTFYYVIFHIDGVETGRMIAPDNEDISIRKMSEQMSVILWWDSPESDWNEATRFLGSGTIKVNGSDLDLYTSGFVISEDGAITKYVGSDVTVVIPESVFGIPVTEISAAAFKGNKSITSVIIPAGITLGKEIFSGCSALVSVTIHGDLTSIPDNMFYGCAALEFEIPSSVISIGPYAFYGCKALTSAHLPNVTTLGTYAFYNCTALVSVILGDDITSIGSYAFRNCTDLSIVIGENVKSIGSSAFYGCTNLKVYFKGDMPTLGVSAIPDRTSITAYCHGSVYDDHNWGDLGANVVKASFWYMELNVTVGESTFVKTALVPNGTNVDLSRFKDLAGDGYEIIGWKVGSYDGPDAISGFLIESDIELYAVVNEV